MVHVAFLSPLPASLNSTSQHPLAHSLRCPAPPHTAVPLLHREARPAAVASSRRRAVPRAALSNGDTIAVVGATGGVGRMLIKQLLADGVYNVRAVVRDPAKARKRFALDLGADVPESLSVVGADIAADPRDERLADALAEASAVVIAVGTTAFPTKAWGPDFKNSPDRVDRLGTENVVAALDPKALQRVVLVSSIGTMRRSNAFFWVLNLCGVLNAKRKAEETVAAACEKLGCSYAIVRPGRLVGGPHTNPGEHQKADAGGEDALVFAKGDTLIGDISRTSCATAVKHTLEWEAESNVEYCVIHAEGSAPTQDFVHRELGALVEQ